MIFKFSAYDKCDVLCRVTKHKEQVQKNLFYNYYKIPGPHPAHLDISLEYVCFFFLKKPFQWLAFALILHVSHQKMQN